MSLPASGEAFRRLVISLGSAPVARAALDLSAQLAAALELELEGLFIEDESLFGLTALPRASEVKLGTGRLAPLELAQLEQDLARAASRLEEGLARAARLARTPHRFSRQRGEPGAVIGGRIRAGDIVVVVEASSAWGLMPVGELSRAALRARASLLLIPRRLVPRPGSVVAIATDTPVDERTLALAGQLALRRGERLEIFPAAGMAGINPPGETVLRGRLVVLPRTLPGLLDERALAQLATRLAAPLLVLEPLEETP